MNKHRRRPIVHSSALALATRVCSASGRGETTYFMPFGLKKTGVKRTNRVRPA